MPVINNYQNLNSNYIHVCSALCTVWKLRKFTLTTLFGKNFVKATHLLKKLLNTVEPRLLRRLGHIKYDAIFEVDAIFEGRSVSNLYFVKRFGLFLSNVTFVIRFSIELINFKYLLLHLLINFWYFNQCEAIFGAKI